MSDLAHQVLEAIANGNGPVSSIDLASKLKEDHQRVIGAIKSLQGLGELASNGVRQVLIEVAQQSKTDWILKEEGQEITKHGSHEFRVLRMVVEGKSKEEIEVRHCVTFFQSPETQYRFFSISESVCLCRSWSEKSFGTEMDRI
jgi:PheRS DNA binding domain 1